MLSYPHGRKRLRGHRAINRSSLSANRLVQGPVTSSHSHPRRSSVQTTDSPSIFDVARLPDAGHRRKGQCSGRQQRRAGVHELLARRRHRPVRSGQHRLLHRWNQRTGRRKGGPVVHPGRDAFRVPGDRRVHGELHAFHPRRRLQSRQRRRRRRAGQALRQRA